MKLLSRILIPGLILGCVLTLSAQATTLLHLTHDELARESALVVTGRCAEVETEWRQGELFTLVTLEVNEVLKGEPAPSIRVLIPGGVDLDGKLPVAVTWPGAPTFTPNENVLLFLVPNLDTGDEFFVTGFSQGKLSLVTGDDGRVVATRDLSGVRLHTGSDVRPGTRHAISLNELKATVLRTLTPEEEGR